MNEEETGLEFACLQVPGLTSACTRRRIFCLLTPKCQSEEALTGACENLRCLERNMHVGLGLRAAPQTHDLHQDLDLLMWSRVTAASLQ